MGIRQIESLLKWMGVHMVEIKPKSKIYIQTRCLCLNPSDGESLANFYFALSMLELEEDFDDMKHPVVDEPKSEPYPSDIPACEPIRGGIPCEFLFCIFQL